MSKETRNRGLIPGLSKMFFSFPYSPENSRRPRSLLSSGYLWLSPWVDSSRPVRLTSYLHLLLKLTL